MRGTAYSEKEIQMFAALGLRALLDTSITVVQLYKMAVDEAFIENLQGPAVESLRRTYGAMAKCHPYRQTKEWDDLISLEDR